MLSFQTKSTREKDGSGVNLWKVHLLADLLAPGLTFTCCPVPAHLLLYNTVSARTLWGAFNLAVIPNNWLVAVDVQTLLGWVFNVAKRVVWV